MTGDRTDTPLSVWVLRHGGQVEAEIAAIYDNEPAAMAHAAFFNALLLDGVSPSMVHVERWAVRSSPPEMERLDHE